MSKYDRVYNFSAGPSVLPLEVLEKVQKELLNYNGIESQRADAHS